MNQAVVTAQAAQFDYAAIGLSAEEATHAVAAAARIRRRIHGVQTAIFEIGKDLLWAKEALGHGNFLPWIASELDMSASTARRYMDVAENLDLKFVTVTNLPPATLYSLASPSTPATLRSEVVEKTLSGAPVEETDIKYGIAAARKQAAMEKAKANAKKTPEARKREKERQARRQRDWDRELERRAKQVAAERGAAEAAVLFLRETLGAEFAEFQRLFQLTTPYEFGQAMRI